MNYLVYLHSIWITQKKLSQIFKHNSDYKYFFDNINSKILVKYWFNEEQITKILLNKKNINFNKIESIIESLNIKLITINDNNYPKLLKQIYNFPYFLYVRGELKNDEFFSIVWSRKMTSYTKKVWENIIPDLTKYFTIVSWWAWGCDSLAHKITLDNNKKTVSVFWTWIDIIYPSSNKILFDKIIDNWGALISIFPLWTIWSKYSFPIRNEIVAWMSLWTLVLEAWEKSWTLITANLSLELWRELFAIPWDIFNPNFIWTNNLIKNSHAKLITSSDDILNEFNYKIIKKDIKIVFWNKIQEDIFTLLKYNLNLSIDELIEKTKYSYWELSLNLSIMELNRLINKDMFWKYEINNKN